MYSKLIAFVFLFSTLISCQSNSEKKIIIESDSLRKVLEEHDSIRIIKTNSDIKR